MLISIVAFSMNALAVAHKSMPVPSMSKPKIVTAKETTNKPECPKLASLDRNDKTAAEQNVSNATKKAKGIKL